MATQPRHHALVIGASGLIGWSVVNQLLQPYPSPSPFIKVTALVNRPLRFEDSFWPEHARDGPELSLIPGANLLCDDTEFKAFLKENVPDAESISHVYYFAFNANPDAEQEVELNVSMMRRVIRAVKALSSHLKFFVYPGGTRGYGIYRPDGIFTAPLTEQMASQLPPDYAKTVSYPHYRALLTAESQSQSQHWTWTEICPDAIIGFTPHGSSFSLAGHWATYLSAFRLVHGQGAEIPFPGVMKAYESLYSETSSRTLARVAVYASLHPDAFAARIVNVADSAAPSTMRVRWPQIAACFSLVGVPPPEELSFPTAPPPLKPSQFVEKHQHELREAGVKGVDIWNKEQLDSYGYWLTFDRQLSLNRLRKGGFGEERRGEEGWREAFEMMKKAGMVG